MRSPSRHRHLFQLTPRNVSDVIQHDISDLLNGKNGERLVKLLRIKSKNRVRMTSKGELKSYQNKTFSFETSTPCKSNNLEDHDGINKDRDEPSPTMRC
jgi:ribosomal protein L11